jgi:hypothetical protein
MGKKAVSRTLVERGVFGNFPQAQTRGRRIESFKDAQHFGDHSDRSGPGFSHPNHRGLFVKMLSGGEYIAALFWSGTNFSI